jgi:UrcA family protein
MLKPARASQALKWTCGALAAGLAAVSPAPAQPVAPPDAPQPVLGEVVVMGRYGVGPEVRSLSAPVSYGDLDLTTDAGRDLLRDRVRATAQDLCRRLGEQGMGGAAAAPSCEQDAVDNAQAQEQTAIATAGRPAYALAAPLPDQAPDQAYVAPAGSNPADQASAAPAYGAPAATYTTRTVTNGPVPDTPANRARFGGPMSNGGRRTVPAGN